jgi:hypothetical protein
MKRLCPHCGAKMTKTKAGLLKLLKHGRIMTVNEMVKRLGVKHPLTSHTLKSFRSTGHSVTTGSTDKVALDWQLEELRDLTRSIESGYEITNNKTLERG